MEDVQRKESVSWVGVSIYIASVWVLGILFHIHTYVVSYIDVGLLQSCYVYTHTRVLNLGGWEGVAPDAKALVPQSGLCLPATSATRTGTPGIGTPGICFSHRGVDQYSRKGSQKWVIVPF